jgi:hypothetical protein
MVDPSSPSDTNAQPLEWGIQSGVKLSLVVLDHVRSPSILRKLIVGLILTSLVQLTMFPLIRSTLRDQPDVARRMVNGLLGPLAICDVSPPACLVDDTDKVGTLVSLLIIPSGSTTND